jgi:hypothetical protein
VFFKSLSEATSTIRQSTFFIIHSKWGYHD